jgi:hypothetical protein
MDRGEKLHLSADEKYGHCFKQGMFLRLYEQSLYRFSHTVKPLKPMLERVKGGEPVIYGGLPISSFEKLLEDGAFPLPERDFLFCRHHTLPAQFGGSSL